MQNPNFRYNPFSGILEEDIGKILVPRYNMDLLISKIKAADSLAIEFLGKKGRGKTTHLMYLQKQLSEYPLFRLTSESSASEVLDNPSTVVFIDSIHHLNLLQRIQLFGQEKVIVYTTHWSRRVECLLARKQSCSFNFNRITSELLLAMLNNRLRLAAISDREDKGLFSASDAQSLIRKFGDDYRGIINHLYEEYQ